MLVEDDGACGIVCRHMNRITPPPSPASILARNGREPIGYFDHRCLPVGIAQNNIHEKRRATSVHWVKVHENMKQVQESLATNTRSQGPDDDPVLAIDAGRKAVWGFKAACHTT
jgi:hypothetical protein